MKNNLQIVLFIHYYEKTYNLNPDKINLSITRQFFYNNNIRKTNVLRVYILDIFLRISGFLINDFIKIPFQNDVLLLYLKRQAPPCLRIFVRINTSLFSNFGIL